MPLGGFRVYDGLNRLASYNINDGPATTVTYDALGNITQKSDVGNYYYSAARPHAVTSAGALAYTYDNNGNQTQTLREGVVERIVEWSVANQVEKITNSTNSLWTTFRFGAGRERIVQEHSNGTKTIYIGDLLEIVTGPDGFCEEKYHVYSPEGKVATRTLRGGSTVETRYYHTDGLGSIVAVSDEFGRIEKRFAYDPWGQRDMPLDTHTGEGGDITRGFTDHEHLDDFGLIHMNGRVFDPVLARFLSADPFVQGAGDSQAYNRYSYCGNNPLNATDPSGYLTFDQVLRVVVIVVMVVAVAYSAGTAAAAAGWGTFGSAAAAGAAGGFVGGFVGTLAYGGSLNAAFKAGAIGAVIGAATAVASAGIGTYFNLKQGIWANSYVNWTGRTLSHAVVGGLSSEAQGGEFRHGFYSAALSNGVMHIKGVEGFMGDSAGGWHVAARTAVAALIGGTAAELSGGKFANGAATSAIQHLFNAEMSKAEEREWMGQKRLVIVGVNENAARHSFRGDENTTIIRVKDDAEFISRLVTNTENHISFEGYDRIMLYGEGTNDAFTFGGKFSLILEGRTVTEASTIFTEIASRLSGDMALVFVSCNTGNILAPAVSDRHNITVYAPKTRVGTHKTETGIYYPNPASPFAEKAQFYKFTPKKL